MVGEINITCGRCAPCLRGDVTHCSTRRVLGIRDWPGAMADYLLLPEQNLHVVPDGVEDRQAVFVEPLAAALEIIERHHLRPTDRVAVVGDGRLGLLVAQVLQLTGAETLLIGRHGQKLALAREMGLTTLLEAEAEQKPLACDLVVECSGAPGGFRLARRWLRPRGTLVLKSSYATPFEVDLADVMVAEITLAGSRCGPMAPALRLLAGRKVALKSLVAQTYSLKEAETAFTHAVQPGVVKVLLRP